MGQVVTRRQGDAESRKAGETGFPAFQEMIPGPICIPMVARDMKDLRRFLHRRGN